VVHELIIQQPFWQHIGKRLSQTLLPTPYLSSHVSFALGSAHTSDTSVQDKVSCAAVDK